MDDQEALGSEEVPRAVRRATLVRFFLGNQEAALGGMEEPVGY